MLFFNNNNEFIIIFAPCFLCLLCLMQGANEPAHAVEEVGFSSFSAFSIGKMQKLPLFSWILIRNEGKPGQFVRASILKPEYAGAALRLLMVRISPHFCTDFGCFCTGYVLIMY